MALSLLHPGVYIEEVPSGVRTIAGVATSIALFIGWAPKGSVERAVRIHSFSDFEREFGGLDRRSLLGYAVMHFFANGGSDAYVVRVVSAEADGTAIPPVTAATTASFAIPAPPATPALLVFTATSPGEWGKHYSFNVIENSEDDTRFSLEVREIPDLSDTATFSVVERFENLSMSEADARFVETAVNGRSRIVTVQASGATPPNAAAYGPMTGGADGSVLAPDGPTSAHFHEAVKSKFGTGSVTDAIDLFNLVSVPGETDADTIQSLQQICRARRAFLIVDSDPGATADSVATTNLTASNALNSALYFPWLRAPDPLKQGAIREFPPSGFVAGIFARTDASRGVWKAPAGTDASVNGALGPALPLSDPQNGVLNPQAINCIRTFPTYGTVVWGARTLHGQNDRGSEWKYVPVKRLALFIEESLFRGTQWVVFEPNDEPLWAQIRLNIGAFMNDLFRQGAFQGKTPREAYFVRCDRTTTTQSDINNGIVNILVGFAPLKPAEFVVLKIQQMAGEIAT